MTSLLAKKRMCSALYRRLYSVMSSKVFGQSDFVVPGKRDNSVNSAGVKKTFFAEHAYGRNNLLLGLVLVSGEILYFAVFNLQKSYPDMLRMSVREETAFAMFHIMALRIYKLMLGKNVKINRQRTGVA